MKKLFSVLLALLMLAGLLAVAPITASAAAPVGPSPTATWDFTTATADGSGTGWSWVQSTKTLTLTDIDHSTSAAIALRLPGGVTIILNGTNTIASIYSGGAEACGIQGEGDLTITGSGSLNATGGFSDTHSTGMYIEGNIAIGGGNVTATGGLSGRSSFGMYVHMGNFSISSGELTATGGSVMAASATETSFFSSGLCWMASGLSTINGGTVTATGGNITVPAGAKEELSAGIISDNYYTIINGGAVIAKGGSASKSYGLESSITTIEIITFNGGMFTATGNTGALNNVITVPVGFSYWTNTVASATGASGPLAGNGTTTVIGSSHKYAKVEAAAVHTHTPGAAATCTTPQVCTGCGAQLVPALGHTAGAVATCTTAQSCTVCAAVLVPATGHTAGPAPTCTAAQTCTVCGVQIAPATGHTPGEWIIDVDATATTDGSKHKACTVCGVTLATESIPATGGGNTQPDKGIFGTNARWYGAWWHYLLFFIGFGFIWMWF